MTYTFTDLLRSILGTVAFPIFSFAPGYLVAWLTDLFRFRTRCLPERILWSIALSLPLSLALANLAGRHLSASHTLHCFEAIAVGCTLLLLTQFRRNTLFRRADWSRESTIVFLCMLGVAAYCLLAVVGVQVHHRLYESTISQDWAVRTQLVNAAVRGGVPPANPMFAIDGQAPPLRYYYYWYVLCAQVSRLTGIDAKSALAASCVWSGFALVSCIFLYLKYLPLSQLKVRRQCVMALLVACALGLDVLPSIVDLLLPRMRLYPDIEFWHDDRSPGWLGALIWAPHHVVGLVCCLLGVLLLVHSVGNATPLRKLLHALLAAICFSAAAGTSTYITLLFVILCCMLLLDALWHRQWSTALAIIGTGIFSLALSHAYIQEMLSSTAVSAASSGHRFLQFTLRSNDQARYQINYVLFSRLHRAVPRHSPLSLMVLRLPVILAFYVAEFGFFLFVLAHRIRKDFFSGQPVSANARLLWIFFASFALPAFFLSSVALQTNNDLGRHAGMCMRFVLLLWSVPLVLEVLDLRRAGRVFPLRQKLILRLAAAAFILGLAAQAWEIVIMRIYIPLVDSGRINSYVVALRFPRISTRFYDIRRAMDAVTAATPGNAIVQPNPDGRTEPIFALYMTRQFAAVDDGCEVPFGGDPNACTAIVRPLIALYGGSGRRHSGDPVDKPRMPFNPLDVTPAAFADVCSWQSLSALVAAYTDPVWRDPQSWVWQIKPIYANATARVFLCPQKQATARDPKPPI